MVIRDQVLNRRIPTEADLQMAAAALVRAGLLKGGPSGPATSRWLPEEKRDDAGAQNEAVWGFVRWLWGYDIARVAVCPDHCSPLDFLADLFWERTRAALAMGSRGSGKTLIDAILHALMLMYHKPAPWDVHVGTIQQQADRGYAYLQELLLNPKVRRMLAGDSLRSKTTLKRGSKVEVLTGTIRQMSGPHPQRMSADEIEWWGWQEMQQFNNMASSKDGNLPVIWYSSTRQRPAGLVQRLIDESPITGIEVYAWCVFETIDGSRPAEEGGCSPCRQAACELWEDCRTCDPNVCTEDVVRAGDCKHPGRAVEARGHRLREEVVNALKLSGTDRESFATQQLSLMPGRQGIVYAEFSDFNVSEEAEHSEEGRVYWACDEGWSDPNVILIVERMNNGDLHVVDEVYAHMELPEATIERALAIHAERGIKRPRRAYPDPSGTYMIQALKKQNIPVDLPKDRDVLAGVKRVRRTIRDISGHRSLLIHPRCQRFIFEMRNMRLKMLEDGSYSDEPDKDDPTQPDHGPDALRYLITCQDRAPVLAHGGRRREAPEK